MCKTWNKFYFEDRKNIRRSLSMYKYNFVNTFVKFSSTLKIERFVDYLLILTNTIMICVCV